MSNHPNAPSSYGVLPDSLEGCHVLIGELSQSLQQALARIAALEEQVKLNSRNSSKPPSSDGPGQRGDRRGKPPSGRKPGGQPGHNGHFREAVVDVDEIVTCPPPARCVCGGPMVAHGQAYRHQVFELPPMKPVVTEYRSLGGRCRSCGVYQAGALPPGVPSGQLGPRALAVIGSLASQCHVTQHKLTRLLADVFGLRFSVGCVSAAHGKLADALAPATMELHAALQAAAVKHMDESVSRTRAQARDAVPKMGDGLPKPAYRSRLQTARCCYV